MRLVDADAFIEFVKNLPKTENGYSREYDESDIIHYINEQPTAYDVEEVLWQIKYKLFCRDIPTNILDEIVRKGGVE